MTSRTLYSLLQPGWFVSLLLAASAGAASANTLDDYFEQPLDQLLQQETPASASIGSRTGAQTALSAVVPIDIITSEQLRTSGRTSLSDALVALLPGFNAPRPSITDGTDHAPPFTLRGLNPDQVLVLINGKRRHAGALLHNNGTIGRDTTSVDLNSIPLISVERVEVLRDGAAAQYGSDAIAGVINIVLKGYGHGSQLRLHHGQTHKGDGASTVVDSFISLPLAGDGFANLSAEWRDRGATNRANPNPASGQRDTHFGDPDTQDALLAFNAELPRGDLLLYSHAVIDHRRSRAGAFFRSAMDSRNNPAIYPNGFLPEIAPRLRDHSLTLGLRGLVGEHYRWDLSYGHNSSDYHFYVNNSLNKSLGNASPRQFDSGANRFSQQLINLDLARDSQDYTLAGGLEWREERYRIIPGEPASYMLGTFDDAYGAQGFPGFSASNAVDARRRSYAGYVDLKYHLDPQLTLDAAVRGEHYSDFGSTMGGKLALRYRLRPDLMLRGSSSTGFRAPSLAQSHFSYTGSYRNTNDPTTYYWGNYAVDHPLARLLGARDLKAEKSRHLTLGAVFEPDHSFNASLDVYVTDIRDRIMPTGYISATSLATISPAAVAALAAHQVDGLVYFTNAVMTRSRGLDARLEYRHDLGAARQFKLNAAYHYDKTRIRGIGQMPEVLGPAMADLILGIDNRALIEAAQPRDAIKLWAHYSTPAFDLSANLSRYGRFASTADTRRVSFPARWTLDAEYTLHLNRAFDLSVGGSNLFKAHSGAWGQTNDALFGADKIIPYSQYAPFGHNGAYYYLRADYRF